MATTSATISATGVLDVRLLGGFVVAVDGRSLPRATWRRKRVAGLLKLLALEPSHRLHREQVLEAFWPELDPDAADNNLRFTLHEARKRLGAAGVACEAFLIRAGENIILGPAEALVVDVDAFEQAAAGAWRSDDPGVTEAAIALYAGDLLPEDPYEAWAEGRRAALRAAYLALLRRLADLHLKRGDGVAAVAGLERLVAAEPADEAANARLMRVLARTGERQRALALYDRLVTVLFQELGADPEPATTRLRDEIAADRYPPPRQPPAAASPILISSGLETFLPAPVERLIGREREAAEIGQLLASARLVTLTGPGGVGKTRLALAVAHDVTSTFADGAIFVDLAPLSDSALVPSAIAQAVDLREEPGKPLLITLIARLRERRQLLLIDNVEHVVEAAPLMSRLLAGCPGMKVLATSRLRLRLQGEREYPVGPLALPDPDACQRGDRMALDQIGFSPAVALFVERSRASKPAFALTEENAGEVATICRALDGLPLALELAAAWTKLLPPAALRVRLATGRLALTGGARNLPERQQTIRATIAWSHDLLTSEQQRLFRRLAVFVGGWMIDAAETVAATVPDKIDVLEGLRGLVDQNLVIELHQAGGEPRFALLETIREFGLERLAASGEEEAVRRAHFAHLAALAEKQYGARYFPVENADVDQIALLDRLEAELGNIRAALTWALAHDPVGALVLAGALIWFWDFRGHASEGRTWLATVLALPECAAPSAARGRALAASGNLAVTQGDAALSVPLREENLAVRRAVGDPRFVATALWSLGESLLEVDDLARAEAVLTEGLALGRELGHYYAIVGTLLELGRVVTEQGDLDRAEALFTEGLAWARAQRDQLTSAMILVGLGRAAQLRGNRDQAVVFLEEALGLFRRLREVSWAGASLYELAGIVVARGDAAQAAVLLRESLALSREAGNRGGIAAGLEITARLLASARPSEGALLLGAAAALRKTIGTPLRRSEQPEHERTVAALQTALGEEVHGAAWAEGRQMDLEAVLSLASTVLDEAALTATDHAECG